MLEAQPPGPSKDYHPKDSQARARRERWEKDIEKKTQDIWDADVLANELPGLKVHICSLVAPDSPGTDWMSVYIHSKLMIVDDVFTTHGSSNINIRSMQVDSELNIAHEWAHVTRDLRRRLWSLHTNGRGAQDDSEQAFKAWEAITSENKKLKKKEMPPTASLVEFHYDQENWTEMD